MIHTSFSYLSSLTYFKIQLEEDRVGGRVGGGWKGRRDRGGRKRGMNGGGEGNTNWIGLFLPCVCRFVSWREKSKQRSPQSAMN